MSAEATVPSRVAAWSCPAPSGSAGRTGGVPPPSVTVSSLPPPPHAASDAASASAQTRRIPDERKGVNTAQASAKALDHSAARACAAHRADKGPTPAPQRAFVQGALGCKIFWSKQPLALTGKAQTAIIFIPTFRKLQLVQARCSAALHSVLFFFHAFPMTYCVAIKLNAGLVFLSDSRTNAGLDQISSFRKMMVYEKAGDRFMVLLSAGNLSIYQSVREILQTEQLKDGDSGETISIWNAKSMFDAARVLGAAVRHVHERDGAALKRSGVDFNVSMVFGGQIKGEGMRLFQVYSAGNFI